MLKSIITFGSVILCLVSADLIDDIIDGNVLSAVNGTNFTQFDETPSDKPPQVYHGDKKLVSIVINPIIHNIANGNGGGGGGGGGGSGSQGGSGGSSNGGDKTTENPNKPDNHIPPVQLFAELVRVSITTMSYFLVNVLFLVW
ncbi:uncharacterized protein LOC142976617 [Anticarsia gemmatalis]|uniref:uncharacterized protein LOC142976617 n=1 Tax=Anticarsia gemmatalis TaxID=129554 RepID=UPI003F76B9E4